MANMSLDLLVLKFVVAIVLAAASVAGVLLPLLLGFLAFDGRLSASSSKRHRLEDGSHADSDEPAADDSSLEMTGGAKPAGLSSLSMLNCFSAGLLLGTGLLHFLVEAVENLSQQRHTTKPGDAAAARGGHHGGEHAEGAVIDAESLHFCLLIVVIGLLVPIVVDRLLLPLLTGGNVDSTGHGHSHGFAADPSGRASPSSPQLIMLLLSVHSLFEGGALGLDSSLASLRRVLLPMALHKVCDGIVVGVSIAKSLHPTTPLLHRAGVSVVTWLAPTFRPQVIAWVLVTPGAIVVLGALQGSMAGGGSADRGGSSFVSQCEVVAQCITAGSFVYIALCEIAAHELLPANGLREGWQRLTSLVVGIVFVLVVIL